MTSGPLGQAAGLEVGRGSLGVVIVSLLPFFFLLWGPAQVTPVYWDRQLLLQPG